jgi:hypothetical protein
MVQCFMEEHRAPLVAAAKHHTQRALQCDPPNAMDTYGLAS